MIYVESNLLKICIWKALRISNLGGIGRIDRQRGMTCSLYFIGWPNQCADASGPWLTNGGSSRLDDHQIYFGTAYVRRGDQAINSPCVFPFTYYCYLRIVLHSPVF